MIHKYMWRLCYVLYGVLIYIYIYIYIYIHTYIPIHPQRPESNSV